MVRVDPCRSPFGQPDECPFFHIGKKALLDPFGLMETARLIDLSWLQLLHLNFTSDCRFVCEGSAPAEKVGRSRCLLFPRARSPQLPADHLATTRNQPAMHWGSTAGKNEINRRVAIAKAVLNWDLRR